MNELTAPKVHRTPKVHTTLEVRNKLVQLVKGAPAGGLFHDAQVLPINDDHTCFIKLAGEDTWFKIDVRV